MKVARGDDSGSVLILLLGLTLLCLALVLLVTDASRVYLAKRSLAAQADAAALAGVQDVDLDAYYGATGADAPLPLDPDAARDAVVAHLQSLADTGSLQGEVVAVDADAVGVTVTLRAVVDLPFGAAYGAGDGVTVEATARAEAPYLDPATP